MDVLKSLEAARNGEAHRRASGGARAAFRGRRPVSAAREVRAPNCPALFIVSQVELERGGGRASPCRWSAPAGPEVRAMLEVHHGRRLRPGVSNHLRGRAPRPWKRGCMADLRVRAVRAGGGWSSRSTALTKWVIEARVSFAGHLPRDSRVSSISCTRRTAGVAFGIFNDSISRVAHRAADRAFGGGRGGGGRACSGGPAAWTGCRCRASR